MFVGTSHIFGVCESVSERFLYAAPTRGEIPAPLFYFKKHFTSELKWISYYLNLVLEISEHCSIRTNNRWCCNSFIARCWSERFYFCPEVGLVVANKDSLGAIYEGNMQLETRAQ